MPKEVEFILKDFVRHVVGLKAEDDPAGTGFHREFRILREEQIQNKNEERFSTEYGRREENLRKNRYKDILPRDDRRVKLTEIEGETGTDYINASFIDDVNGDYGYIAAQGPMPHTVSDFWRMLWQYDTEIVFMVCKLKEDGRPKCEKYWAEKGESATFGSITTHTESEEEIRKDFFRRQIKVEKDGETHTLTQFHYVGWPDHNTPSSPNILRSLIEDVRNFRKHLSIPMVVHCSAGCGRTGTICAIDFAWTLLDKRMITEEFSMFEIIKAMREQRMSMVQTPDQYEYTHMVMKALFNEWLVSCSDHDYENINYCSVLAKDEDDVEQTYANMDFDNDDEQDEGSNDAAVEKVVTMPEATKEVEKMVASSQPVTDTSEPVKSAEAAEVKTKAEQPEQKPQKDDIVHKVSGSHPPTMVIADKPCDTGEYVEVMKTAIVPPVITAPKRTTSLSSESQKKPVTTSSGAEVQKKSAAVAGANKPEVPNKLSVSAATGATRSEAQRKVPTNLSGIDAQKKTSTAGSNVNNNFDPHKTVIMLGGSNASPKIIKSGSVGVSHTKQQAPKPPVQAVVKPIVVSMQQQQQQQQKPIVVAPQQQQHQQKPLVVLAQTSVSDVEMVKIKAAAEGQNSSPQNSTRKISINSMSDEDAPDLPSRNYRPEEVSSLPNSPTGSSATIPVLQHPTTPTTTAKASTTSPPQSPSSPDSPTFPAYLNRDRPPQPLPVNASPPQGIKVVSARSGHVVSSGAVVSAKSTGHGDSAVPAGQHHHQHQHQQQQQHHQHHSQAVPGMVSVMIGATPQQVQHVPMARPAAAKALDTRSVGGYPTQPVLVHSHNKGPAPRKGPMMVQQTHHPHLAGVRGPRAGIAPVVVKSVYLTDRPARVIGPKSMPADWSVPGKNHRGGPFL